MILSKTGALTAHHVVKSFVILWGGANSEIGYNRSNISRTINVHAAKHNRGKGRGLRVGGRINLNSLIRVTF